MKRLILLLPLALLLLGCTPSQPQQEHQSDQSQFASLTSHLDSLSSQSIIPGFAVGIVDQDQIRYQNGFGYANLKNQKPFTTSTVNIIASISKTFIGCAIAQLIEKGKLSLDEPINDILPYKVVNPHFPNTPILVRHLVNHTSTLTDDFDPEDVEEADIILLEELVYEDSLTQAFMDEELAYYRLGKYLSLDQTIRQFLHPEGRWHSKLNFEKNPPGTVYSYSNLGADLAAHIVEIKSGMSFNQYTQQHIFEPLGMNNTAWFYQDVDSNLVTKIYLPDDWKKPTRAIEHPRYQYLGYPSGELKTNVEDMSRYLMEMIRGYRGEGKILSPTSYQKMFRPMLTEANFTERDSSALYDEFNVGIFWAVSAPGYRLHNGGSIGVYSFLYFNPATERGAFGFCNLPDRSFGQIIDAVHECEKAL